jgi:hypothetical protein
MVWEQAPVGPPGDARRDPLSPAAAALDGVGRHR